MESIVRGAKNLEAKALSEILYWYISIKVKDDFDILDLITGIETSMQENDSITLKDGTVYTVSFRPEDLTYNSQGGYIECSGVDCIYCGSNIGATTQD